MEKNTHTHTKTNIWIYSWGLRGRLLHHLLVKCFATVIITGNWQWRGKKKTAGRRREAIQCFVYLDSFIQEVNLDYYYFFSKTRKTKILNVHFVVNSRPGTKRSSDFLSFFFPFSWKCFLFLFFKWRSQPILDSVTTEHCWLTWQWAARWQM